MVCTEDHGASSQGDIDIFVDDKEACMLGYKYGSCVEDRCSNWDIMLGECTEQQGVLDAHEQDG